MKKDSLIDFLGFIGVKIIGGLLCCVPLSMALWIGRRIGDIAYFFNSKRRSIAYANLKSAFPRKEGREIRKILKAHFENLGMSAVELLKLPVMGKAYLDRHVSVKNIERIQEALAEKKGVILLTAHFGNWELAALSVSSMGYKMSVFAREQKYPRLNNMLNKYREMTGCRVIAKGFSIREIIKTLAGNGIVAMLADQDAGANGVFVEFFGRPASTASGPVVFSMRTGAVILPSFIRRADCDKHIVEIGEPLDIINTGDKEDDIKKNLERITKIVEDYIKRFPEEWLWSHKRWKTCPKRTVLILSDGKAGHLNQAKAVAGMVEGALGLRLSPKPLASLGFGARAQGIEVKPVVRIETVELKFKNALARFCLDAAGFFAGSRCQGRLRWLRLCLDKGVFDEVKNKYADIIISCGSATIGANILLSYENNAKSIAIMKPGLGRRRRFNLVILPRHDASGKAASNTLVTEMAPNNITAGKMEDAISALKLEGLKSGGRKGIGLLIGGGTKTFKLEKDSVSEVTKGILKMAEEMDIDAFISTSRRTPRDIEDFLKDNMEGHKICKLLVIANEKNIDGVVPAIFALSDVILVSSDSVSMISEAVSSGKYVVVFRSHRDGVHAAGQRTKYERIIKDFEDRGYIKTATPDKIYDVIKALLIEKPGVIKKPKDREKIVERLKGIV